jgi:hypothetical protein
MKTFIANGNAAQETLHYRVGELDLKHKVIVEKTKTSIRRVKRPFYVRAVRTSRVCRA